MTKTKVEAMLKKEKEKASVSTFGFYLKPSYQLEIATNFILLGCLTVSFNDTKFILVELGRTRQFPGKDPDAYVRRFYERALNCCVLVAEDVLVNVCLHDMMKEYLIHLDNLLFASFSYFIEATTRQ